MSQTKSHNQCVIPVHHRLGAKPIVTLRAGTAWITLGIMVCFAMAREATAQTEKYFPPSTKGFITFTNVAELSKKMKETSLSKMGKDPEVKEFVKDFLEKLKARIRKKSKVSFGLDLQEVQEIVSGEFAIGLIQPKPELLGVVTIAEFSDAKQVDDLLAKVKKNLLRQKGVVLKGKIALGGADVDHYEFPDPYGIPGPPQVFYGRNDKWIISYYGPVIPKTVKTEHLAEVRNIVDSLENPDAKRPSLLDVENYRKAIKPLLADGEYAQHDARWYADSFGFIDAAAQVWPEQFDSDQLGTFRKVGFDAIKSLAGLARFADGDREVLLRGFIYAPPVGTEERYSKAARMLDFTDTENRLAEIPNWATLGTSTYGSVHWQMLKAFDSAEALVDELYGEETYKRTLDSFKTNIRLNKNFDLRNEMAAKLGNRMITIRDPMIPATEESRRVVMAIEIKKDPQVVTKTLDGFMANEDQNLISRKKVKLTSGGEVTIYVRENAIEVDVPPDEVDPLDDLGLDLEPEPDENKEEVEQVIKEIGFAVHDEYLFVSPDVAFLESVLKRTGATAQSPLNDLSWFQRINAELDKVKNPTFESLRFVMRLDLPYKAAFELFKAKKGDLPIEKRLKALFEEEYDEPLFDVKKLPKSFDKSIAPYLNVIGWSMTTEDDGWLINGIFLKQPEDMNSPSKKDEKSALPNESANVELTK